MRKIFKVLFLFILSIFMIIFAFSNTSLVEVDLFFWEIKIRLFLLLIFAFVLGLLFASAVSYCKSFFVINGYRTKIKKLEKDLKNA